MTLRKHSGFLATISILIMSSVTAAIFLAGDVARARAGTLASTIHLPIVQAGSDPVVLAAADQRSGCNTGAAATANLLDRFPSDIPILSFGDFVDSGTTSQFTRCYDTTWGRHRSHTRPVPGNHEYATAGAAPYFAYFGPLAGVAGEGYYSFDIGDWHVIGLNAEIDHSYGSGQEQWLRADLASNRVKCTLAYWHEPRFSSGLHGGDVSICPIFEDLYDAGAEIVLNGHDHDYERFAPQNPSGEFDSAHGIREFVVGTGGVAERPFGPVQPNSEVRNNNTWGVLQFTLRTGRYDWEFLPVAGGAFTDSGSDTCH